MRKNMKRKTNVKSSIMVLMLIAILLIASTYAWFTSNRTVTINSIDVNVAASSGIQISVDGITWKTVIDSTDILAVNASSGSTYTGAVNQLPTGTAELAPVSSAFNISNDRMEMFYGVVTANESTGLYELTASEETDQKGNGRYIAFDVFIKVDQNETIYLTENSDVVANGADKGIKNAARVAFCILGHSDDLNASGATYQSLTGGNTVYVWEPNYDVHSDGGKYNAENVYTIITSLTGGSKLGYYAVSAEIPDGTGGTTRDAQALNSTSNTYFTQIANTTTIGTVAGRQAMLAREGTEAGSHPYTMGTQELMSMNAGVSKVRIYMWIEGQDVDCENSASGTQITFDLGFTIDETEPHLPTP